MRSGAGDTLAALSGSTAPPSRRATAGSEQAVGGDAPAVTPGLAQIMAQMRPMLQQMRGPQPAAPGASGVPSGSGPPQGGGAQSIAAMMGPIMQQMGPMISQVMGGGSGNAPSRPTVSNVGSGGLAAMMQQMASSPDMQQMAAQLAGGMTPGQADDDDSDGDT